jgi:hypothetical protein
VSKKGLADTLVGVKVTQRPSVSGASCFFFSEDRVLLVLVAFVFSSVEWGHLGFDRNHENHLRRWCSSERGLRAKPDSFPLWVTSPFFGFASACFVSSYSPLPGVMLPPFSAESVALAPFVADGASRCCVFLCAPLPVAVAVCFGSRT